jgi:hypothetical protein
MHRIDAIGLRRASGGEAGDAAVTSPAVPSDPAADLPIASVTRDQPQTLAAWVTLFHLLGVVLDPYTLESSWIIQTASRIFAHYREADVRTAYIVTADAEGARAFLGPYAREWLVLLDPERQLVQGLGLQRLPALVHIRQDVTVAGVAEGWNPEAWSEVLDGVELAMAWRAQPVLPHPADPGPFAGTAALG